MGQQNHKMVETSCFSMIRSDVVSNGVWISDLREERVRPRGLSLNLQQASTLAQQILEARMLMHQINYHLQ